MSGEVYDLPLHMQPILGEYSLGQSLPVAEEMCGRHVCLPVHSDMRDDGVGATVGQGERTEDAAVDLRLA